MNRYLITDITIMEAKTNPTQYYRRVASPYVRDRHVNPDETVKVDQQIVHLEEFDDFHGKHFQIGMTKDVEKFIGFPITVFKYQSEQISILAEACEKVENEQSVLKETVSTFWGWFLWRFKYAKGEKLKGLNK